MELITSRIALHSILMKLSHLLLLRIDFVWRKSGGRRKTFRMQTWRDGREAVELQRRRCRRIITIVDQVRGQFAIYTLKRSNDMHTKSLIFEASSHNWQKGNFVAQRVNRIACTAQQETFKLPDEGPLQATNCSVYICIDQLPTIPSSANWIPTSIIRKWHFVNKIKEKKFV